MFFCAAISTDKKLALCSELYGNSLKSTYKCTSFSYTERKPPWSEYGDTDVLEAWSTTPRLPLLFSRSQFTYTLENQPIPFQLFKERNSLKQCKNIIFFPPRRQHTSSPLQRPASLMLCRVIIPVYSVFPGVFGKQFRKGAVNRVTSFFHLSARDRATVIGRIFVIQGYRKRWTGFETAITWKVLDGFTRFAS